MTTPTKLSPEEFAQHKQYIQGWLTVTFSGLARAGAALVEHSERLECEHRALVADNAALLEVVRTFPCQAYPQHPALPCRPCIVKEATHPGAALLSEMEALRKRVAELEEAAKQKTDAFAAMVEMIGAERDEARAQVATARAAALEEAATKADEVASNHRAAQSRMETDVMRTAHAYAAGAASDAAAVIRALATTQPPPVVPVAKVREVLLDAWASTRFERPAIAVIAQRLGINLDGEQ